MISGNHHPHRRSYISSSSTVFLFTLCGVLFLWLNSVKVNGEYPNTFPYYDTCMGIDQSSCYPRADKGTCNFYTDQYPWCFDKNFANIQPQIKATVGASTLFFTFSSGVHLSGEFLLANIRIASSN